MMHTINNLTKWPIVSQNREDIDLSVMKRAEREFAPALIQAWQKVELATGHAWMCTSYWRDSPNHVSGMSLDIAPMVDPAHADYYAVSHLSDPVLYKRLPLMRDLQRLCHNYPSSPFLVGFVVENDHIHIQLFAKDNSYNTNARVIKWKVEKPCYPNSASRMLLPATEVGYDLVQHL